MPVPGAMGAIASVSRRRRQGTSYKPSVSKQSSLNSESAPSVLTRFKQQAQETGVFLKKQQQALSLQVQKGIKMASSLKPTQKKDQTLQQTEETYTPTTLMNGHGDEQFCMREPGHASFSQMGEWASALAQMGFEKAHICEAAQMLGGQPEHFDDLLQAVVALAASEDKASSGGASSSSMRLYAATTDERPSESEPFFASSLSMSSKDEAIVLETKPPLPSSPSLLCMPDDKMKLFNSVPTSADNGTFDALSEMGFEVDAIHAAAQVLGEDATVDDYSDLLLRMPDINQITMQAPMDTSAVSVDVLYDGNDYESEEEQQESEKDQQEHQQSSSVLNVKLVEPSSRELAAVVVASAIVKAAQIVAKTAVQTKKIGDQPSPVRGGA